MQASSSLSQCSIHTLSYTIVLGSTWHSSFHSDLVLVAKLLEFVVFIFTTIVGSELFDLQICLIFHHCFPSLESFKYFRLMLQKVYSYLPRVIFDKSHKVMLPTNGWDSCWTPNIRVNKLEFLLLWGSSTCLKANSLMLSKYIVFTYVNFD